MLEVGHSSRFRLAERNNRKRAPLVALSVLSLIILVLSRHAAEASVFEKARATMLDAAQPVLEFFAGPINAVASAVGSVEDYFDVIDENRKLKVEIAELKRFQWQAQLLRDEVDQLSRLAAIQMRPEISYVVANVIGESGGPFLHAMIVDVGREQGVERGHAVVDERGMVGHVITVGRTSSRILLLTDLNSHVPVFIEGADTQAILTGGYDQRPLLQFIEDVDPSVIEPGQNVVTSGRGGILPRGLPVGRVAGRDAAGLRVELHSDYDRTQVVRVLRHHFPDDVNDEAPAQLIETRDTADVTGSARGDG